ncbi:MAG: ATP-binding protein [Methanobacteriaceae archaeon]|nr:ATP-binding protein [Methanobacteriaceae archaeon]
MPHQDYYHNERIQNLFNILKEPKSLDEIDLGESFIQNLLLKLISSYGIIEVAKLRELTGLHFDILEECLSRLEKENFCYKSGGGFLFASVEFTIKKLGNLKAKKLLEEEPYMGIAPVSYDKYCEIMEAQLSDRFPTHIPENIIEHAFDGVIGVSNAKKILVESATSGQGFFISGAPGTGKTFLTSKMPKLMSPIVIPKFVEFSHNIIQIYDPDFHQLTSEQPEDPRWVKIYAPFIFTGSELTRKNLETHYNPQKGLYETSPIIKANGGVLLLDDLGRQKEDPNDILNRLIVPLENKKDVIYVKGTAAVLLTHFIPAMATNMDITIIDEAHLRRAPLYVFMGPPSSEEILTVFKNNLDELNEKYDDSALERFMNVYLPREEGGEDLKPTFAHARDIALIAQAIRVTRQEDIINADIIEEALKQHILIVMQRNSSSELQRSS